MACLLALLPAVGQPAKGLNDLGVMAFDAKRYAQALEHFTKALALDPENPAIRRNACAVHQAVANELAGQGEVDAAIARVQQGIDVDPSNASALTQSGAYHLAAGKPADAESRLRSALALAPDDSDALFLLGEACYQQNKLAEAEAAWGRVLAADPDRQGLQEKYSKLVRESEVEQDFNQYSAGHFQISYAKALSEETRAMVFAVLEEAYDAVGTKLGGLYPPDVVQVVLYDGAQFAEATGTAAHVGALYDGKIRAPITARNGRFLSRGVLSVRLTHEYVHVVLTGHLGPRLPWWLNEGLAEVFSREMDQNRTRTLGRAIRGDRAHALRDLEARQLDRLAPEALAVAYAQAHAVSDVLWREGGAEKMGRFVGLLREGKKPEDALGTVYGLDYARLEGKVAAAFR